MAKRLDQILVVDPEAICWPGEPPVGQESDIIEIGLCTPGVAHVPGQFHAYRRHEPLPLWMVWRSDQGVHLQQHDGGPLPGGLTTSGEFLHVIQDKLRAAAGPGPCYAQVDIHIEVPR